MRSSIAVREESETETKRSVKTKDRHSAHEGPRRVCGRGNGSMPDHFETQNLDAVEKARSSCSRQGRVK